MNRTEAIDFILNQTSVIAGEFYGSSLEKDALIKEVTEALGTLGVSMKEIETTPTWRGYVEDQNEFNRVMASVNEDTAPEQTPAPERECYCCTCSDTGLVEFGWDPACRLNGGHGKRECIEHNLPGENCDCGCGYIVTEG